MLSHCRATLSALVSRLARARRRQGTSPSSRRPDSALRRSRALPPVPAIPPLPPGIGLGLALLAVVAALAWPGGLLAAAPAPKTGSFSETAEVTVVQVPVQVVRDGEPVKGLTAADFELYDGRRKQTLTGFEVLDLASRQGPAVASIPPSLRRHFLFLFDLSNAQPKSLVKARQMVRDLLPSLHASDLVAVATYASANGPKLLLGFTSDHRQVLTAVDRLDPAQMVDLNPDPLDLSLAEAEQQNTSGSGAAAQAKAAVVDNFASLDRVAKRAEHQQEAAVVTGLIRSFTDLARMMANVHGRKEVIYLSEGFDTSLLQGTADQKEQDDMRDLSATGQGFLIDSDQRYGDTRQANVLEKMMEEFRRADCVIQSVDIGGERAGNDQGLVRPNGTGALFAMSHDTGGELYHNFNNLGTAMGQLMKKTSITYVLTFQPDEVKSDGTYHKLRVELKGAPRGTQLFFRTGYYAPKPYGQQSPLEKRLAAADSVVGGGDSGAVTTALLVAPFRLPAAGDVAAPKANVPVVIEADGASLLKGNPGDVLPTEIYAYAIDSGGAIQDFFSQSMRFDLSKVPPALRQNGLKFFGHLDLPPGEYNVRVLVRNGATGAYGLRAQPLVVPPAGAPEAVLLTPFFPEAPGRWMMVRETVRDKDKQKKAETAPYPFVVQERAYIPASRPVLGPGQDAAVALVGYNLPAGGLKAEARVLAADGRDLGAGDLKIAARENPDAEGEDRLTATFRPPLGLEPGEYQLVVVITDARGVAHNSATHFVVPAPVAATAGGRG